MSIFATVVDLPNRSARERVAVTLSNAAAFDGEEMSFGLGAAHIEIIRMGEVRIVSALDIDPETYEVTRIHTVAIVPGEYRAWEVRAGRGGLVHGEFHGLEAALGTAIDLVGAASMNHFAAEFGHSVNQPDAFGC